MNRPLQERKAANPGETALLLALGQHGRQKPPSLKNPAIGLMSVSVTLVPLLVATMPIQMLLTSRLK